MHARWAGVAFNWSDRKKQPKCTYLGRRSFLAAVNSVLKNDPLARKYRPSALNQICAQESFARIITNAIKADQLPHAYLLSGMRGIGKTSLARVIAKTVNCSNPELSKEGLLLPCGACSNCRAFALQNHPDVIEMDAASHTGVDDVRLIIEGAEYKPLIGKYKVYIIDEVHMLSRGAFNALLKTLEEPPEHLIFILATTEAHKVPATIISRCQKFDLRRFSSRQLCSLLTDVCQKEGIQCQQEALELIASKSEGSARDALSLLDQIRMASEGPITVELVRENLSLVTEETTVELLNSIFEQKAEAALSQVKKAYEGSLDLSSLLESLLEAIAICCKFKLVPEYKAESFLNFTAQLKAITDKTTLEKLLIAWQLTFNTIRELKDSSNYLLSAEMLTAKMLCALGIDRSREDGIHSLLESLFARNWFEVFYYLVNEVEIIEFDQRQSLLSISKEGSSTKLNAKLKEALKGQMQLNISVVELNREPVSLKSKLIEKIKCTDKWETLRSCFQVEEISDILFLPKKQQ
jgi:DNA polymerase III subunit gamma/tau